MKYYEVSPENSDERSSIASTHAVRATPYTSETSRPYTSEEDTADLLCPELGIYLIVLGDRR